MSELVLHNYFRSSTSIRVRTALNLKGLGYRYVAHHLRNGDHRKPAYLAVNPQGAVPSLELEDGTILTQSLAIIEYLEETRPEPALLPEDAAARAHVRALALAVACEIHPVSNLRVLDRVEALAGSEARAAWNRENIARGLEAVERLLDHPGFAGRFCHGDRPGMADCVLIPQIYNARRWGVNIDAFARIQRVEQACKTLIAFRTAFPENVTPQQARG